MQDPHISHIVGDFESSKCVFLAETLSHKFSTYFFFQFPIVLNSLSLLICPTYCFPFQAKNKYITFNFFPLRYCLLHPRGPPLNYSVTELLSISGHCHHVAIRRYLCISLSGVFCFSFSPSFPPSLLPPSLLSFSLFFSFFSYVPSFLCLSFPLSTIKKCVTGC